MPAADETAAAAAASASAAAAAATASLMGGDALLLLPSAKMVVARVASNLHALELREAYSTRLLAAVRLGELRRVELAVPPGPLAPVYRPWLVFALRCRRAADDLYLHAPTRTALARWVAGLAPFAADGAPSHGAVLWAAVLGRARHRARRAGVSAARFLAAEGDAGRARAAAEPDWEVVDAAEARAEARADVAAVVAERERAAEAAAAVPDETAPSEEEPKKPAGDEGDAERQVRALEARLNALELLLERERGARRVAEAQAEAEAEAEAAPVAEEGEAVAVAEPAAAPEPEPEPAAAPEPAAEPEPAAAAPAAAKQDDGAAALPASASAASVASSTASSSAKKKKKNKRKKKRK